MGAAVKVEFRALARAIRGPARLLAAVGLCLGAAGPAAAQFAHAPSLIPVGIFQGVADPGTCGNPFMITATPVLFMDDTTGAASVTGGEVGGPFPCGPMNETPSSEHVYQFTVIANNDLTFQVTTADMLFDPSIYILSECGNENSCVAFVDTGVQGQGETIGPMELGELVPGTYFFYVDSFYGIPGDMRGEGPYELEVTGSLAVELIEFTIE